jgi:hypothetical protein
LVFYFGNKVGLGTLSRPIKRIALTERQDPWVPDYARDKLITARGRSEIAEGQPEIWRPRMLIDQDGIPHNFCIGQLRFQLGYHSLTWKFSKTTAKPWQRKSRYG